MLTDAELVERFKSGERAVFEALFSKYQDMVFNIAWSISGDRELAEDITQEAFVKAYLGLSGFRGRSAFKTWLYRIAVNQSLRMRSRTVRRTEVEHQMEDMDLPSEEKAPDEAAETSEKERRVREAIAELPEAQRAAVTLRYLEGLELAEVAEVLGTPLGTVKSRIHHALKRISYLLRDWKDA